MAKITIEKAEKELTELQSILKTVNAKVNEIGGPKNQLWLFNTRHKIYKLEDKIKDLKTGKTRTDEPMPESVEIEKRIERLTDSLEKITKGKE